MSDKDNKFEQRNANLELRGLEGTNPNSGQFNEQVYRGKEIAEASDRAKQMINDQSFIREHSQQDQSEREAKYKDYGIQRERSILMEKQFSSPQPIPNDPQAREVMQREIDEGAVRNYEKKNQYYRDQIDRQYKKAVDQILKQDHEGQLPSLSHAQNHSQNHEHEHGER